MNNARQILMHIQAVMGSQQRTEREVDDFVCDHRGYERVSYRWPLNRLATTSDASPTQMYPSLRPPRAHGPHLRPATHCETVSTFSHFETGVVSGGIRGLLASWMETASLALPHGLSSGRESLARRVLFRTDGTARHRFCSLSIDDAEQHRQDSLCGG